MKTEFKTIRIRKEDYDDLLKVSEKSQVPIVRLVKVSVAKLKTKYRIKNEVSSNGD